MAFLWNSEIDNLITVIPGSGERLQCVEFSGNFSKPILIVSAYLPTACCNSDGSFMDCTDQLAEIHSKFSPTHDILIGGDLNVDFKHTCEPSLIFREAP